MLLRRCLPLEEFDRSVEFYETLLVRPVRLRFDYPEQGLRLAQVANLLIIGGSETTLKPFVATQATFLVDDIHSYAEYLPTIGVTILKDLKEVPTGWNLLALHPDGTRVEYVEHRDPNPADEMQA